MDAFPRCRNNCSRKEAASQSRKEVFVAARPAVGQQLYLLSGHGMERRGVRLARGERRVAF